MAADIETTHTRVCAHGHLHAHTHPSLSPWKPTLLTPSFHCFSCLVMCKMWTGCGPGASVTNPLMGGHKSMYAGFLYFFPFFDSLVTETVCGLPYAFFCHRDGWSRIDICCNCWENQTWKVSMRLTCFVLFPEAPLLIPVLWHLLPRMDRFPRQAHTCWKAGSVKFNILSAYVEFACDCVRHIITSHINWILVGHILHIICICLHHYCETLGLS